MSKRRFKKNRRTYVNIPICMTAVLFWLVLFTTYIACGLFAKYTTSGESDDAARVIKFKELNIIETVVYGTKTENGADYIFIPGVDLTKNVQIIFNGSEADTLVFVLADTPGWTASIDGMTFTDSGKQMTWSVASGEKGWTHLPITLDNTDPADDNWHVYYRVLKPSATLDKAPFIATAMNDTVVDGLIKVSPTATRADYASYKGFVSNIKVTAYAVQANGFAGTTEAEVAAAAWDALN